MDSFLLRRVSSDVLNEKGQQFHSLSILLKSKEVARQQDLLSDVLSMGLYDRPCSYEFMDSMSVVAGLAVHALTATLEEST